MNWTFLSLIMSMTSNNTTIFYFWQYTIDVITTCPASGYYLPFRTQERMRNSSLKFFPFSFKHKGSRENYVFMFVNVYRLTRAHSAPIAWSHLRDIFYWMVISGKDIVVLGATQRCFASRIFPWLILLSTCFSEQTQSSSTAKTK